MDDRSIQDARKTVITKGIEKVLADLKSSDLNVRVTAMGTAARLLAQQEPGALKPYLVALKDEDAYLRGIVVALLAEAAIHEHSVLLSAVKDSEEGYQLIALLKDMSEKESSEKVSEEFVREEAKRALDNIDDLFKNAMQDAFGELLEQPDQDEPQVVDKITAPVSESLERVVDESQNLVGIWLPDAVDVEGKVPVILSLEMIPLPGSYRVVSNSGDERGGCFVMFEAARAPGETETQYQQSLAAEEWFKKGVLASQQGEFQQAVKCFDKATAGQPFSPEAWNNKAIALASLNRNEEAIKCCDKAIELKPSYADAWDIKGRALGRVGKFHEALPVIEKFIELAPPDATDRVKQAKRAVASLRRRL